MTHNDRSHLKTKTFILYYTISFSSKLLVGKTIRIRSKKNSKQLQSCALQRIQNI